jgi:hypothetical protein
VLRAHLAVSSLGEPGEDLALQREQQSRGEDPQVGILRDHREAAARRSMRHRQDGITPSQSAMVIVTIRY